jgi:hypothetical protein
MNKETKLRIHNITAKAALKFGSEAWVLKKREEQHLEAAQMKFLRHLLGITKLDKEKNQCFRKKIGVQSIVTEIIKQYQQKSEYVLLLFHGNKGYANALDYYVIHTYTACLLYCYCCVIYIYLGMTEKKYVYKLL